jgi:hypothetical protein
MSTLALADVERIAREYDRAWNAKDIDAILARHASDGTYQLHVAGAPTYSGREALRAAFSASLENWSEISFEFQRVLCGDRFFVWQSRLHGVLARPLALVRSRSSPTVPGWTSPAATSSPSMVRACSKPRSPTSTFSQGPIRRPRRSRRQCGAFALNAAEQALTA